MPWEDVGRGVTIPVAGWRRGVAERGRWRAERRSAGQVIPVWLLGYSLGEGDGADRSHEVIGGEPVI